MKLRKAALTDGDAVLALYREAQAFLAAQGIDQWQDGYPNRETFLADVGRGRAGSWRKGAKWRPPPAWAWAGSPPTTSSMKAPGAQRPRSTPSSTALPCPAPARGKGSRPCSSRSWSARPGRVCPACGGYPQGEQDHAACHGEKRPVLPGRHLPGGRGRAPGL